MNTRVENSLQGPADCGSGACGVHPRGIGDAAHSGLSPVNFGSRIGR
jgi:hypothetical protein